MKCHSRLRSGIQDAQRSSYLDPRIREGDKEPDLISKNKKGVMQKKYAKKLMQSPIELKEGYKALAQDEKDQQEALEWSEALIGDLENETW